MTAAERADKIIKELRGKFLIGGQRADFLRSRIIEEIQKAEKEVRASVDPIYGKASKTKY
jgi:hypothetical protein